MGALVPSARRRSPGRGGALAFAAALFIGVFALRMSDPNVGDGDGYLFVVPLAVLALGFGLRGGLAGALLAFALLVTWDLTRGHAALTFLGYVDRGIAFFVLGALLGGFVDHRSRVEAAQRSAELQLADSARSLKAKVAERTRDLDEARAEAVHLLARAAEYRDDATSEHTERVGAIAGEIAARLGIRAEQIERLREAASLHDVGKLAIPDAILLKRGNLDEDEQEIMRTHAALGARLLAKSSSPVLQMAATIAATHHEWWDGTGYPQGLADERIPLVGRIVAVADVFDALTHDRPYKAAWPMRQAVARIKRASGSQFDPWVVEAFLATIDELALAEDGSRPPIAGDCRSDSELVADARVT